MDQAFAAEGADDPKQRGGSLLDMITTDRSIKGSRESKTHARPSWRGLRLTM